STGHVSRTMPISGGGAARSNAPRPDSGACLTTSVQARWGRGFCAALASHTLASDHEGGRPVRTQGREMSFQGRSTSAGEGAHMHLFLVRQPLAEQVADARARTVDTAIRTRVPVSIEERASLVPRRKFI